MTDSSINIKLDVKPEINDCRCPGRSRVRWTQSGFYVECMTCGNKRVQVQLPKAPQHRSAIMRKR